MRNERLLIAKGVPMSVVNLIRLYSLPVVQSGAVKPGGQAQVYMFTPSVHSSPLVQGLESHSLISVQIEFQRQWME